MPMRVPFSPYHVREFLAMVGRRFSAPTAAANDGG
jgi:hypothetical protein